MKKGLNISDLSGNRFTGTIPPPFWLKPKLIVVKLSGNSFTGTLPLDLSRTKLKSM